MQEISLSVFAVCIFLIGFVLGFFSLFMVAGIDRWFDKREKRTAKKKEQNMRNDEFDKIKRLTQPEEVDDK